MKARVSEEGTLEIALFPAKGTCKVFAVSNIGISSQGLRVIKMCNGFWTDISAQSLPKVSEQYLIQRYATVFPDKGITPEALRTNGYPAIWYQLQSDGDKIIAVSGLELEPAKELFRMRLSNGRFVVEE